MFEADDAAVAGLNGLTCRGLPGEVQEGYGSDTSRGKQAEEKDEESSVQSGDQKGT
jgi:hypothetical protein